MIVRPRLPAWLVFVAILAFTVTLGDPWTSHARPIPGDDSSADAVGSSHLSLAARLPRPHIGPDPILPPDLRLPGPATAPLDAREVNAWIEATLAAAPGQDDNPFAGVDACVTAEMERRGTPGASLAIAQDGQVVYTKGYGVRHPTEGGDIDVETQFRIGSETKMMTAAAVMQLAEQGKVDLDAPLSTYLPDVSLAPPWELADLTLHHLLGQDSGVPDTYLVGIPQLAMPLETWATAVLPYLPLNAPPGSFWNYSNPNFSLAGLVVQRLGGLDFNDYVAQNLWAPAGMTHTTMRASEVTAGGNYATGYTPGADTLHPPEEFDLATIAPAGAAFSTPSDMVRWATLLMEGGGDVLAPESAAAMQDKQVFQDYLPWMYYGYGVFVDEFQDLADATQTVPVFEHGGNVWGYSAQLYWVPERRMAVSVLSNTMQSLSSSAICALREVAGVRPREVEPTPAPPETWDEYRGTYAMMNAILWDFTARAVPTEEGIQVNYLDLGSEFVLQPYLGDTFLLETGDPSLPILDFTFIRDKEEPATVRWLRFRTLVGQRIGQFPAAVAVRGDGCGELAFTADTDLPSLDIAAFGLDAPILIDDEAVAQDDPSDPATASFKQDVEIRGGANLFMASLTNQPGDILSLYLLYDADDDGDFAFPGEVLGAGQALSATEALLLLSGRQPAGAYQLWVHGVQVPGDESTFDLTVDLAAGENLRLADAPTAVEEGDTTTFQVCAESSGSLTAPRGGMVDFDYGYPPRRVRIPVAWEAIPPVFLPLSVATFDLR